ncbi:MAG: rod shape-determining protein MreC [Kiritimatiellia bacterium]
MKRRLISFFSILALIVTLYLCHAPLRTFCTEAVYPFRRLSTWVNEQVAVRFSAAWRGLCDGPIRATSELEVERLRVMLEVAERTAQETEELRAALGWVRTQPTNVLAVPVWSHGGGLGVWPRLVLGAGSESGISAGDTVVVPEGLVGRIDAGVTAHTSEVILISDPGCRVAAEVFGVAKGIVEGARGNDWGRSSEEDALYVAQPLRLRFIDKAARLVARQQVLTEGSGGLFPRGIVIGSIVEKVQGDPEDLLGEARIEPAVNPALLRTVFVLRRGGRDDR